MFVWGGYDGSIPFLNTGGYYNPSTNSWTSTTQISAPSNRDVPTFVWTGSEVLVWGGFNYDGTEHFLNTGGRYRFASTFIPTATLTPTPTRMPTLTQTLTSPAPSQWHLAGFAGVGIYSIAFSPNYIVDHTVLIGGFGGVFRSTDNATSWIQSNTSGVNLSELTFSPNYESDQTVFAASAQGIYRSIDGGMSWNIIGFSGTPVQTIAISPNYVVDHILFAGINANNNGYVFRSDDGGFNWVDTGLLVSNLDTRQLGISPGYANDHTIFLGTGRAWDWYSGGVYRSTNGGNSWTAINNGLTYQEIGALAISPNYQNDHTLFITAWSGGVFRSTNGGDSWVEANNNQPNRRLSALGFSPNYAIDHTIFLGTWGEYGDGGAYASTDGGNSWTVLNNGLTTRWLHRIVVSPNYANDYLVLAGGEQANGGGLWAYGSELLAITATPTLTPTVTSTGSQISTPTPTINPTLTLTRTVTRTPTRTITLTRTLPVQTPTWTQTLTATGSMPTRTSTQTSTPTRTLTITATQTSTPTITRTNHPTLTATSSIPLAILTISDGVGIPGLSENRITVGLDNHNTGAVTGAEWWLVYDSTIGMTLTSVNVTSRTAGFNTALTLDTSNPAAVKAHVLLYNLSGATIPSGSGPILELSFNVSASAILGVTSPLSFANANLSNASGNPIPVDYSDQGIFTIQQCMTGDVNCNGAVNIFDLQNLINMILHLPQPDTNLRPLDWWTRADLNGDNQWNIFDLQQLINIIQGRNASSQASMRVAVQGTNQVSLENVQSPPGTTGSLGLILTNQDAVAGGEMWLTYDSRNGMDITNIIPTNRTNGFSMDLSKDASDPAQVKLHILFYNLQDITIAPGNGSILGLNYNLAANATGTTGVHLETMLLSDASGSPLLVDQLNDGSVISAYQIYLPLVSRDLSTLSIPNPNIRPRRFGAGPYIK